MNGFSGQENEAHSTSTLTILVAVNKRGSVTARNKCMITEQPTFITERRQWRLKDAYHYHYKTIIKSCG